jgi:hypothetical protein
MATEETITVYRGEQATLNFTMSPVVDITGWTIVFTVAAARDSATKKVTATATIVNGPAGTFRVALTEEHLDLAPLRYFFDVWRTDEGLEQVLALGPFVVVGVARVPPV